jgi:hypothetical protein
MAVNIKHSTLLILCIMHTEFDSNKQGGWNKSNNQKLENKTDTFVDTSAPTPFATQVKTYQNEKSNTNQIEI